jgi:hypothetical protein
MTNPLSDYYIDKRCLINFASLLLICLPLVVLLNHEAINKQQLIPGFPLSSGGEVSVLVSLMASGFVGLTGAAYLQSLKDRKPS